MPSLTSAADANHPLCPDRTMPVHFVGIGGVGMSGLAKLLLEAGFQVSGSDVNENAYTKDLAAQGCVTYRGHAASQVPNGEKTLVIVSSSIDKGNPEIAAALERGLPIAHRSALLRDILEGPLMGYQTPVGITGTHGKTTITGMTGLALRAAGLDPGIIVGGKLPGLGTNAVSGSAERRYAVAELDESDGTLLQYKPALSVIANIELDHADYYTGGLAAFVDTFRQYIHALKPGSKVFYNADCPNTRTLIERTPPGIETILLSAQDDAFSGEEPQVAYSLKNVRLDDQGFHQGDVYRKRERLGALRVGVPGAHNLFNALCALAVGDQLGADFAAMAEALQAFTGMGRRFEKVGQATVNSPDGSGGHALLIDDYAHHPTEVEATLRAAQESLKGNGGRVIAVFQPHRYSRLKALWAEFCTCFHQADQLFLADVYAAHEPPIPGITSAALAKSIQGPAGGQEKEPDRAPAQNRVRYIPTEDGFDDLRAELRKAVRPGDIVLSMGAGSITKLLRQWETA